MGTEVSLTINGMTLDWSKNAIGIHHGPLFQEKDRIQLPSEDPDFVDPEGAMALRRALRSVAPRLEMMGVRLEAVRSAYESAAREWSGGKELAFHVDTGEPIRPAQIPLTFEEFLELIRAYPLNTLDKDDKWDFHPGYSERKMGRFADSDLIARIPNLGYGYDAYCEQGYFVEVVNFLGPHETLRLLSECPENLDLQVEWGYGPLVSSGWVTADQVYAGPQRRQRTLVATEGKSDVHILRHALKLLRPDVADFFSFVDVSEGHPFSGAGNLANFAKGLAKIDVHNQVILVFDNDAEGVHAAGRVKQLNLPVNMRILVLPDLDEFKSFPVQGPDGVNNSDINGRAAAIECYLDLRLPGRPEARAQWSNLTKEGSDVYQGALQHKESYSKAFYEQTAATIGAGGYETAKLEKLLDALIEECCSLAMASTETD